MKKLFALCLLAVTMCAIAQEKKDAVRVATNDTLSNSLVDERQIVGLGEQDNESPTKLTKQKSNKKTISVKDLILGFNTTSNNKTKSKRQQRRFDKYVNEYKSKMSDSTLTKEEQIKMLLNNF